MKQRETKKVYQDEWTAAIERALTRAAEEARKVARFYGTPIYIQEKGGKVIAVKP
ncbi:MAG: hypothetical protein NT164_02690 [Verrucomicrobiae bacterium]|nr:hypothetical protein [Verrucomicrobiae bacterium]